MQPISFVAYKTRTTRNIFDSATGLKRDLLVGEGGSMEVTRVHPDRKPRPTYLYLRGICTNIHTCPANILRTPEPVCTYTNDVIQELARNVRGNGESRTAGPFSLGRCRVRAPLASSPARSRTSERQRRNHITLIFTPRPAINSAGVHICLRGECRRGRAHAKARGCRSRSVHCIHYTVR